MQIVQPGETRTRVKRSPNFPLAGTLKPFGLYPMMLLPVLPGETLESFDLNLRCISMPVRHPLFGAWHETWVAYVKFTDIDLALAEMFISTTMATTGFTAAADSDRYFTAAGQVRWAQMCTETVWRHYFADDSERYGTIPTIDGVPMIKRRNVDWTHNLMFKPAALVEADLPSNPEGQLTGVDIMSMMGLSELTYEKYLQQYGVSEKATNQVSGRPEILRYAQSWTVPTNQVEPSNGAPSSAWTWQSKLSADKPKRFDEPGFLIVLQAVRAKMLSDALRYSITGEMWGFADFFPAYNLSDPAAGLKVIKTDAKPFKAAFGPDGGSALSMLYDHRDILSRGEQFVNAWSNSPYYIPMITGQVGVTTGDTNQELRGQYPLLADVNNLFVENLQGSPVEARRTCYYEGIASCTIRGHVKDTTL